MVSYNKTARESHPNKEENVGQSNTADKPVDGNQYRILGNKTVLFIMQKQKIMEAFTQTTHK